MDVLSLLRTNGGNVIDYVEDYVPCFHNKVTRDHLLYLNQEYSTITHHEIEDYLSHLEELLEKITEDPIF